jgi:hypothetical protein
MRYPRWSAFIGFFCNALFRIPFWFNSNLGFWKIMGCGKNGSFDLSPDLRQWVVMGVFKPENHPVPPQAPENAAAMVRSCFGRFVAGWLKVLQAQVHGYALLPTEGHGQWDGAAVFGNLPKNTDASGPVAILTRATIRLNKLGRFWQHVGPVSEKMATAPGFVTSYGIGEIPFVKQATFSIWESRELMRAFAYQLQVHKEVIVKTRKENWYREDLFVRFRILYTF